MHASNIVSSSASLKLNEIKKQVKSEVKTERILAKRSLKPTEDVRAIPLQSLKAYFYCPSSTARGNLHFKGVSDEARQLWQDYMQGRKNWSEIVDEAHCRELEGRASLLKQWNIRPKGYKPKSGEDVIIRTGTNPIAPAGRGEFSDEDLTANTMKAWHQLQECAKQNHLKVEEDFQAGFCSIPELSTIVWKPKEDIPIVDRQRFFSNLVTLSTHPEIVDPSSERSKFSIEYVLAMINKAQKYLCKPVEAWGGNSYERYESLIQLAKSTHHALERTGLERQFPEAYKRFWDLCKMKKSPEQLEIFKPGDSEKEILSGLKREQKIMQRFMQMAFNKAQQDLKQEMHLCKQQAQTSPICFNETEKKTFSVFYEHLLKIKMQLKILNESEQHSSFMHRLFNDFPDSGPLTKVTDEKLPLQPIENLVKVRRGSYQELDSQIAQQLGVISHKLDTA